MKTNDLEAEELYQFNVSSGYLQQIKLTTSRKQEIQDQETD